MMDTASQLSRFFICISIGILGGFLYEITSLIAIPWVKRLKWFLRFMADVLFFVGFAVLCVKLLNLLIFPRFREYYYLGFAIGLILYLKTFHKAVDFFKNICYNCIRKLVNCIKSRRNFRKKEEKNL